MTLNEFKAWLEGFEESFADNRPGAHQWKKIKEKLDSISVLKPPVTRDLPNLAPQSSSPFRDVIVGSPIKRDFS